MTDPIAQVELDPSTRYSIDLLTTDELSMALGVPKSTLENWRSSKKGPKFVKYGRHVRYQRKAVEDWLNSVEK